MLTFSCLLRVTPLPKQKGTSTQWILQELMCRNATIVPLVVACLILGALVES